MKTGLRTRTKYSAISAALLCMGSAVFLISCGKGAGASSENSDEMLITRRVDSLFMISTKEGTPVHSLRAAVMEEHALAKPSYEEYRQGIEFIGYNDSTGMEASRVVADYALHWIDRDLWQLNGNVVVTGEEDRRLYTQQLRWDRKLGKVYSNVDSRLYEGEDYLTGVGFEADDHLANWTLYDVTGTVGIDTEPTEPVKSESEEVEPESGPVNDSLQQ